MVAVADAKAIAEFVCSCVGDCVGVICWIGAVVVGAEVDRLGVVSVGGTAEIGFCPAEDEDL